MGQFAIAEVLHPSGGPWGANEIDNEFKKLLARLFSEDLVNIFTMSDKQGQQSYMKLLENFSKAKISFCEDYDEDQPYHNIPLPSLFINFVIRQYQSYSAKKAKKAKNKKNNNGGGVDGILFITERGGADEALHKVNKKLEVVSEVYNKIAAAAVGEEVDEPLQPVDEDNEGMDEDENNHRDLIPPIITSTKLTLKKDENKFQLELKLEFDMDSVYTRKLIINGLLCIECKEKSPGQNSWILKNKTDTLLISLLPNQKYKFIFCCVELKKRGDFTNDNIKTRSKYGDVVEINTSIEDYMKDELKDKMEKALYDDKKCICKKYD